MARKNEQGIILANGSHSWEKIVQEKEDEDGYIYYKAYYVCSKCGLKAFNNIGTNCPSFNLHERHLAEMSCTEHVMLNILK